MVFFNYALRKLNAKIVYYGPGLCGKTTNLLWIHDHFEGGQRGKMLSLATEGDRTIFFDLLPIDIGSIRGMQVTLQLYTVPGQVHYNSTRQLVLRGADGVVFVADSQSTMGASNVESLKNLEDNLGLQGVELEGFPCVLQFNKRDIKGVLTVEEMDRALNRFSVPIFEAVATDGVGVQETLEGIVKLVMRNLRERYEPMMAGGRPRTAATPARPAAPAAAHQPATVPIAPSPSTAPVIPPVQPAARPAAGQVVRQQPVPSVLPGLLEQAAASPGVTIPAQPDFDVVERATAPPRLVDETPTDVMQLHDAVAAAPEEPSWQSGADQITDASIRVAQEEAEPPVEVAFDELPAPIEPPVEEAETLGGDIEPVPATPGRTVEELWAELERTGGGEQAAAESDWVPGDGPIEGGPEEPEGFRESMWTSETGEAAAVKPVATDWDAAEPAAEFGMHEPSPAEPEPQPERGISWSDYESGAGAEAEPESEPAVEVTVFEDAFEEPSPPADEEAPFTHDSAVAAEPADLDAVELPPPGPAPGAVGPTLEVLAARWEDHVRAPGPFAELPPKERGRSAPSLPAQEAEPVKPPVREVQPVTPPAQPPFAPESEPLGGDEESVFAALTPMADEGTEFTPELSPFEPIGEPVTPVAPVAPVRPPAAPVTRPAVQPLRPPAPAVQAPVQPVRPPAPAVQAPVQPVRPPAAPAAQAPPAAAARRPAPAGARPELEDLVAGLRHEVAIPAAPQAQPRAADAQPRPPVVVTPPAAHPAAAPFELPEPAFDVAEPAAATDAGPFTLGDGDPFAFEPVVEVQVAPAAPAARKPEVLAPPAVAGSQISPVTVQARDNQLRLQLKGTGALAEYGQVREMDIVVPVPGEWVGHRRVTLQLRLTLEPAAEDDADGGAGGTT